MIIILKMQRCSIFQKLKGIIYQFFLHQNQLHFKFQLLLQLASAITYIAIINGVHFNLFKQHFHITIMLIVICLLKSMLKITLGMAIYLIAVQQAILFTSLLCYVNLAMVAILIVADTVGCICFDFSLSNVAAESNNNNKIYHATLLIVNVLLTPYQQMYVHLVSFVLFLVIFLLKDSSLVKNSLFKQVQMRLFLWLSFQHLRIFLVNVTNTNLQWMVIAAFAISQLIFSIYIGLKGKKNLFELSAKEQYLQLSFYVLRNYFDQNYDQSVEKFCKDLLSEQLQSHEQSFLAVSHIFEGRLSKKRLFLQDILILQINIINGRLFNAKAMLLQLAQNAKWYNIINKILIYRMEQFIAAKYYQATANITVAYQHQYKHFLAFQELIHKAALQNLKFNLCLKKTEIQLTAVKQTCSKIISYNKRIKKFYSQISQCFISTTQMYVAYLLTIENNNQQAEKILNKKLIQQKYMIDFNLQHKLYLNLQLKQESILIRKVGLNSKNLLSYNKKQLQGQTIERFLPPFFRKSHQNLCSKLIRERFEQVLLYKKKTIILNNNNTYNECNIVLKLSYRINQQFVMQGHIHVLDIKKYNLDSFLFVAENGNIIEFSDNLTHSQPKSRNNLNVDKYFDKAKVGYPLSYRTSKGIVVYNPLIKYSGEEPFYFYSKQILQSQLFLKIQSKQLEVINLKKEERKRQVGSVKIEQMEKQLSGKQLWILMIIFGFFVCCLFVSEYLLIESASVKYNNQQFAVKNSRNLIRYYNYSLKLQLDLVYADFRDNFNYTNSFVRQDFVNSSLQMQSLNENLKKYVIGKFKLNTYNPKITYYQTNFEAIQMLLANAYLYRQFQNDSFIKNAALDNYKLLSPVLVQSALDYKNSILNLMASFVQNDAYYDRVSLIIALANQIVFLFIIFPIFYKIRGLEQKILKFRCYEINFSTKAKQILQFLKTITAETPPIQNQQINIYDNFQKGLGDSNYLYSATFLKSEMSLIKQSPGRNVLNDSFNNTGFIEEISNNKGTAQSRYIFKQGKTYRIILVAVSAFVLVLVSLTVANYIANSSIKNLNELQSVNSVILLYRSNGFYAVRGVIPTFTTILLKQIKNVNNIKVYTPTIQAYYASLSNYTLPIFPQTQFPQFNPFSIRLNNMNQKQICSYMVCDPKYKSQLNLNFIIVINKLSANLSTFVNVAMNMTKSQFASDLKTPSTKLYIDLLFYSQIILTQYVVNTVMLYLQNYTSFMDNLYSSKMRHIYSMIGVTLFAFCLFIVSAIKMKQEIDRHKAIIKIYESH